MIYSYHGFTSWTPKKLENEKEVKWYIGTELEIDAHANKRYDFIDNNIEETTEKIRQLHFAECERDGSLSYNGIEIITHPLSIGFIRKNEKNDKKLFNYLISKNYASHDASNCGLHVHVSRPKNDKIIDRIILILETYQKELTLFSRRRDNHWCRYLTENKTQQEEELIKSLYYIKKEKNNCDRYMALNLRNTNTIEFRIFRGTLNYDTYRASIELVNTIMEVASDLSININNISWDDLTTNSYVKDYCMRRNITTDKKVKDNTQKIKELEHEQSKELAKARRILKAELLQIEKEKQELYNKASNEVKDKHFDTKISIENTVNMLLNYRDAIGDINRTKKRIQTTIDNLNNRQNTNKTKKYELENILYYKLQAKRKEKIRNIINGEVFNLCV